MGSGRAGTLSSRAARYDRHRARGSLHNRIAGMVDGDDINIDPSGSDDGAGDDADTEVRVERHEIHKRLPGRRLDKYLRGKYPRISRTVVQRFIKQGLVTVNGLPTKASYEPALGDVVEITSSTALVQPNWFDLFVCIPVASMSPLGQKKMRHGTGLGLPREPLSTSIFRCIAVHFLFLSKPILLYNVQHCLSGLRVINSCRLAEKYTGLLAFLESTAVMYRALQKP